MACAQDELADEAEGSGRGAPGSEEPAGSSKPQAGTADRQPQPDALLTGGEGVEPSGTGRSGGDSSARATDDDVDDGGGAGAGAAVRSCSSSYTLPADCF